jgi:hypothetical protein
VLGFLAFLGEDIEVARFIRVLMGSRLIAILGFLVFLGEDIKVARFNRVLMGFKLIFRLPGPLP